MAPTIIVGDDENAGDVAARLLELADHQRQVKTRTDGPKMAFEVTDEVYEKYTKGGAERSTDEERANAVQRMIEQQGADDPDAITSDDELPDLAKSNDPYLDGDLSEIDQPIEGDELPDAARNIDPPANGSAPDDGSGNDPDADAEDNDDDDQAETPKPKPARKRAARKATKAAAPAATGSGESRGLTCQHGYSQRSTAPGCG